MTFGSRLAAILLVWAGLGLPQAASAQADPPCNSDNLKNFADVEAARAFARRCADNNMTAVLLDLARMVADGFNDHDPDWRLATEIKEEVIARTRTGPYANFGARIWAGTLQGLSYDFERGNPNTGWPQDFERAWKYHSEILERISKEPTVSPDALAASRQRLAELTAKRDLARRRSGKWTGDIAALSDLNIFAPRDRDPGAARLTADGFVGIISSIVTHEVDDLPLIGYDFKIDLYAEHLIGSEFVGVCLVIRNADDPRLSEMGMGMLYVDFAKPPFRQSSGPYPGWYRLSPKGGRAYAPVPWFIGAPTRSISYEFRPVTDPALCNLDM